MLVVGGWCRDYRLAACLEVRRDEASCADLIRHLEPSPLGDFGAALDARVRSVLDGLAREARLPTEDELKAVDVALGSIVAVEIVTSKLGKYKKEFEAAAALTQGGDAREGDLLVGFVEVSWHGKVERTCFPLPRGIKYLTNHTKKTFLDEVRYNTLPGCLISDLQSKHLRMCLIYSIMMLQ